MIRANTKLLKNIHKNIFDKNLSYLNEFKLHFLWCYDELKFPFKYTLHSLYSELYECESGANDE